MNDSPSADRQCRRNRDRIGKRERFAVWSGLSGHASPVSNRLQTGLKSASGLNSDASGGNAESLGKRGQKSRTFTDNPVSSRVSDYSEAGNDEPLIHTAGLDHISIALRSRSTHVSAALASVAC